MRVGEGFGRPAAAICRPSLKRGKANADLRVSYESGGSHLSPLIEAAGSCGYRAQSDPSGGSHLSPLIEATHSHPSRHTQQRPAAAICRPSLKRA